jgi:hypothetical protein
MPNPTLDSRAAFDRIDDALDFARLDEIGRLAALASSYWRSVEAADRGDRLTVSSLPSPATRCITGAWRRCALPSSCASTPGPSPIQSKI